MYCLQTFRSDGSRFWSCGLTTESRTEEEKTSSISGLEEQLDSMSRNRNRHGGRRNLNLKWIRASPQAEPDLTKQTINHPDCVYVCVCVCFTGTGVLSCRGVSSWCLRGVDQGDTWSGTRVPVPAGRRAARGSRTGSPRSSLSARRRKSPIWYGAAVQDSEVQTVRIKFLALGRALEHQNLQEPRSSFQTNRPDLSSSEPTRIESRTTTRPSARRTSRRAPPTWTQETPPHTTLIPFTISTTLIIIIRGRTSSRPGTRLRWWRGWFCPTQTSLRRSLSPT